MFPPDHQERGDRPHHGAARGVAGRARRGLHAVVFQDAEVGAEDPDFFHRRSEGERKDAGSDRHAEAPAGFQAHVKVGKRHHSAQQHPHKHGSHRELRDVAPVMVLEPLPLDFVRSLSFRIDPQEFLFRGGPRNFRHYPTFAICRGGVTPPLRALTGYLNRRACRFIPTSKARRKAWPWREAWRP